MSAPVSSRPHVPLEVARHVLFWMGDENLGLQPGEFHRRLLYLLAAADRVEQAKLACKYPEYVRAWDTAMREPWGVDWLRGLVKAELDHAAGDVLDMFGAHS